MNDCLVVLLDTCMMRDLRMTDTLFYLSTVELHLTTPVVAEEEM